MSRKIKHMFRSYLDENHAEKSVSLYPEPVLSRWGSWFKAAKYIHTYVDILHTFFRELPLISAAIVQRLAEMENARFYNLVKSQAAFVYEHCNFIADVVLELEESKYPYSHLLISKVSDLKNRMNVVASGHIDETVNNIIEGFSDSLKNEVRSMLQNVGSLVVDKIDKHMSPNDANNLFLILNDLFHPSKIVQATFENISQISEKIQTLPNFKMLKLSDISVGYLALKDLILKQTNEKPNEQVDIMYSLKALKLLYLNFANAVLKSIWAPCSSVDAERFFLDNVIVNDRRRLMKENSVVTCAMLSFSK